MFDINEMSLSELQNATVSEQNMFIIKMLIGLHNKVDYFTAAHSETVTSVEALVTKVEPHLAELGPMIDAIASNPMFKMLAGGKKR